MKVFNLLVLFSLLITIVKAQPSVSKKSNPVQNAFAEQQQEKKTLDFGKRKSAFENGKNEVIKIWDKPDVEAQYAKGYNEYVKLITKNLKAELPLNNKAPNGNYSVKLNVTFNDKGEVQKIEPITKFGYGMEAEAERVFKLTVKDWKPATVSELAVNSIKTIIISFQILGESVE